MISATIQRNINHRRQRKSPNDRRGTQIVEVAFVLPIFFLFTMTGIEFARLLYVRHSVEQAAYEACRVAVTPGSTQALVQQKGGELLRAVGVRDFTITLTAFPPAAVVDENTRTVTVRVEVPFASNSFLPPTFFRETIVRSQLTLDHENAAFLGVD
jgi:Flp pilus assembly protein TadG